MDDGAFTHEVRARFRWADIGLLLAVPVALVVVFALPRATRLSLAFRPSAPTLLTAFTSHFTHLTPAHLLANLLSYALLAPLVYLLCLLSGHRWLFHAGFAAFLLVFPFVLSGLELALEGRAVLLGFSGINGTFFGLLAFALARYIGVRFAGRVDPNDAPPVFFVGLALIATVAVPSTFQSVGLAVAALLSGVFYLEAVLGQRTVPTVAGLRRAAAKGGYFELAGAGIGLFLAYPFLAFPAEPVGASGIVNLYGHLLGFALAFIATYLTALLSTGPERR